MDLVNILIMLIIAAALFGFIVLSFPSGRKGQLQKTNTTDADVYTGLRYLLSDQHDRALNEFISLLRVDSATAELHITVGTLFRKRGEIDRAILIHEEVKSLESVSKNWRDLAHLELGLDYLSMGWYDRGQRLIEQLPTDGEHYDRAILALLDAFEMQHDWEAGLKYLDRVDRDAALHGLRHVHYLCELAELELDNSGNFARLINGLPKNADQLSMRPQLIRVKFLMHQSRYDEALDVLVKVCTQFPQALNFGFDLLLSALGQIKDAKVLEQWVDFLADKAVPYRYILKFVELLQQQLDESAATGFVNAYMLKYPSLRALQLWLHQDDTSMPIPLRTQLERLLEELLLERKPFRCDQCGFSAEEVYWQCPGCRDWESMRLVQGLEGG